MHPGFQPLLAKPVDWQYLDYGNLMLSPKLDGIRAIVINGVVYSRKLKPIPNAHVQRLFGRPELEGFDGELICGAPNRPTVYGETYSAVMTQDGEPSVGFHVFDHIGNPQDEFILRHNRIVIPESLGLPVTRVEHHLVEGEKHLLFLEEKYLEIGFEGVMLRKFRGPQSRYKFGRSTPKEGTLLKLKRFEDAEAEVIGFEEEMANMNRPVINELGHTERSSDKAGLVGKGTLGNLICRMPSESGDGVTFSIGSGFTAADRRILWQERDTLVGRIVKYKSFDYGVKDRPRFPVFLGFRDPIDT